MWKQWKQCVVPRLFFFPFDCPAFSLLFRPIRAYCAKLSVYFYKQTTITHQPLEKKTWKQVCLAGRRMAIPGAILSCVCVCTLDLFTTNSVELLFLFLLWFSSFLSCLLCFSVAVVIVSSISHVRTLVIHAALLARSQCTSHFELFGVGCDGCFFFIADIGKVKEGILGTERKTRKKGRMAVTLELAVHGWRGGVSVAWWVGLLLQLGLG